jgi:putative tryptophan/tyrosine transport system substrate-binding protein
MKRREFITLIGGAAAWPLPAYAQQSVPVIGFLSPVSPDGSVDSLRAFQRGLKETGYVEGENVTIVQRHADNRIDRLPSLAAELVRKRVNLILANSSAAFAAKSATKAIPIAFIVAEDPVRIGLVASLARPGGNLTGVNFVSAELVAKRLELLRDLLPRASRIALIVNPAQVARAETTVRDLQAAADTLGLQVQVFNAASSQEINAAFAAMAKQRPDALFLGNDPFFSSRRVQIVQLAARHGLPAIYPGRQYPEIGGLISYGTDSMGAWRQAGAYAGRILKGTKPAELPVMQASKFELIINAETARMLGVAVPTSMLTAADEVLE